VKAGRCCSERDESVRRVTQGVFLHLFSNTWRVACEARWTHVSHLRRRWLAANLPASLLAKSLNDVLTMAGGLASEARLASAVAESSETEAFRAGQSLRLVRLCKVLLAAGASAAIAACAVLEGVADSVLWEVLGRGGPGERCTLLRLADPQQSPVRFALERLSQLARGWGRGGGQGWKVVEAFLPGPCGEATWRQLRALLLQIHTGLADFFEMRLAASPYVLATVASPLASQADKLAAARTFTSERPSCAGLLAERLRAMY